MRIISWNVNSVRERLRALRAVVRKYAPDVVCLQETKVADELFPRRAFEDLGLTALAIAGQKGYHGVAIASRLPIRRSWTKAVMGLDEKRHIAVALESGTEIHNLYVPAGGQQPNPDKNPAFARKLAYLRALGDWMRRWPDKAQRSRVLVGDFNVAPLEHDVWDHHHMRRWVTHTEEEIALLDRVQATLPWTDVGRAVIPAEHELFTWWSYRAPAWRRENKGRRLDHAWVSGPLASRIEGFSVAREVRGWKRPSDHAPLVVDLAE